MPALEPATRRVDAQRNRDAILEAGLQVLAERPDAGLAEIARASGLTRTTVYAHFADRNALLEELLGRAVDSASATIEESRPAEGPAPEALARAASTSWRTIARNAGALEVASRTLGEQRAAELHAPVRRALTALIRRGRDDGSFRRDVPADWLLTTYFALVHAAGREVLTAEADPQQVEEALVLTLLGAFRPA